VDVCERDADDVAAINCLQELQYLQLLLWKNSVPLAFTYLYFLVLNVGALWVICM